MLDKDSKVQGIGVYAEFTRNDSAGNPNTSQFYVFPDGYDNSGKLWGPAFARRVVSADKPKAPWRYTNLEVLSPEDTLADDARDEFVEARLSLPAELFDMYVSAGWTLVADPILIEVSRDDWDDMGAEKAPSKFLHRMSEARKKLGYPLDLFPKS